MGPLLYLSVGGTALEPTVIFNIQREGKLYVEVTTISLPVSSPPVMHTGRQRGLLGCCWSTL